MEQQALRAAVILPQVSHNGSNSSNVSSDFDHYLRVV
jgi:hypothetical protein